MKAKKRKSGYFEYAINEHPGKVLLKEYGSRRSYKRFVERTINNLQKSKNEKVWQEILRDAQRKYNRDWYGSNASFEELANPKQFKHLSLLKQIRKETQKDLRKFIEYADDFNLERKKIAYNDKEIGVFSFDRAAIGLRKGKVDGRVKFVSDVRKSYAWQEVSDKQESAIKIYIPNLASSFVTSRQFIYNGMTAVLIAQTLVEMGYDVAVYTVTGTVINNIGILDIVSVKDVDTDLNVNDLMLMTSDIRYMRHFLFKGVIAQREANGLAVTKSLGSVLGTGALRETLYRHLQEDTPILLERASNAKQVIEIIKKTVNFI